jgi:hypothetical protein
VNADHCLLGRSILAANLTGVKTKSTEADYVKGYRILFDVPCSWPVDSRPCSVLL